MLLTGSLAGVILLENREFIVVFTVTAQHSTGSGLWIEEPARGGYHEQFFLAFFSNYFSYYRILLGVDRFGGRLESQCAGGGDG